MPADYVVSNGKKPLAQAIGALDSGLFANPLYPLVAANGRISSFAGLAALKAARIDILAASKERTEECDLGFRRGEVIYVGWLLHCFFVTQDYAF